MTSCAYFAHEALRGIIYLLIHVGLPSLLVSTNRAMREPLHCGTGDRAGSTFLCVWAIHENKHCQQGSRQTANKKYPIGVIVR